MSYSGFYISESRFFLIYEDIGSARKFGWGSFNSELALLPVIWSFRVRTSAKITYSVPKEPILFLERTGIYWKVIIGENIGWIMVSDGNDLKILYNNAAAKK